MFQYFSRLSAPCQKSSVFLSESARATQKLGRGSERVFSGRRGPCQAQQCGSRRTPLTLPADVIPRFFFSEFPPRRYLLIEAALKGKIHIKKIETLEKLKTWPGMKNALQSGAEQTRLESVASFPLMLSLENVILAFSPLDSGK